MSKKMGRNQRRRARREAHARQMDERNRERGFSSGDLTRVGGHVTKTTPQVIDRARAKSKVGQQTPSHHNRKTMRRLKEQGTKVTLSEIEVAKQPHPNEAMWDEVKAEAKARKKSLKVLCQRRGWGLVGQDPKKRESWVV